LPLTFLIFASSELQNIATASGIDHTSRVLIHLLGADTSLLSLYRYGAGYVGWSIDRSHSEP